MFVIIIVTNFVFVTWSCFDQIAEISDFCVNKFKVELQLLKVDHETFFQPQAPLKELSTHVFLIQKFILLTFTFLKITT